MKKKLFTLLLAFVFVFSLSACGTPSPTEVTTSFLQAVKEDNANAMAGIYAGDDWMLSEAFNQDLDAEEDGALDQFFQTDVYPKILDFDYEIVEEKIDGEKATVKVKITTWALGDAFADFFEDYFSQAFVLAFGGADETELETLAVKIFKEKVTAMEKTYTDTVSISLSLVDDAWVIDEMDEDAPLINALFGNMVAVSDDINDAFEQ